METEKTFKFKTGKGKVIKVQNCSYLNVQHENISWVFSRSGRCFFLAGSGTAE